MNYDKATAALESLTPEQMAEYTEYFSGIKPLTDEEFFRRGLFAHASVHTTWRMNVRLYSLLWDLEWTKHRRMLREIILESGSGLVNNRGRWLWTFAENYWKDPAYYRRAPGELWCQYRDRLQGAVLGLGHSKTSFFVELCYFEEAEVVCGDTHQLQLYGLKGNSGPGDKMMNYMERHWVQECARLGLPPVNARWALWDRKQGRTDSRYWSHVLESNRPTAMPRQLKLFDMVA